MSLPLLERAGGYDMSTFQRRLTSSEGTLSLQLCDQNVSNSKVWTQAHQLPLAEPVKM